MILKAKHLRLGSDAETMAAEYLSQHGLTLKARNYRSRWGEVDLIMNDGDDLVFIEVRCRSGSDFANVAETIDQRKQRRIARTALCYVQENAALDDTSMRFDVVLIEKRGTQTLHNNAKISWLKGAFDTNPY